MDTIKNYVLPAEDVNEDTAIITEIFFENGDIIKKDDILYTFETTKATVDVLSDVDGYVNYFVEAGQEVKVGALVCEVSDKKISNKNIPIIEDNAQSIFPTKKAQEFAEKHSLDLKTLGLSGIVKEKNLLPFINTNSDSNNKRCKYLEDSDVTKFLIEDNAFRFLSSAEKVERYRNEGFYIGEGVSIGNGSVIVGNKIDLEDGVIIGENTFIEAPEVTIKHNSVIGNNCEIVGSVISIGCYNRIANDVKVDLSGGRHPDSNLITGKGCLIATDVYINVCREVLLGDNVALSPRAMVFTHSYWQSVLDGYSSNFGTVVIEKDSWVGAAAQVMPNVVISTGSIVMSNSLVVNNVNKNSLVGGVPAVLLKDKLKKDYSHKVIVDKLGLLLEKLMPWLYGAGCNVEKTGVDSVLINYNGLKKSCSFYDLRRKSPPEKKSDDIVIVYDSQNNSEIRYSSLFIISEKKVVGSIGKIESLIIDYFRRNGIDFYG